MADVNILNILIGIGVVAVALGFFIWLFSAPVRHSKARGTGMMIGAMLAYMMSGSNSDGGSDGGGDA